MPADGYTVDYEEITRIYRNEKKAGRYLDLPRDFYRRAVEYIRTVEEELVKEGTETEFYRSGKEQVREMKKMITLIWKFRTKKICDTCIAAGDKENIGLEGLTDEEMEFQKKLQALLAEYRRLSLEGLKRDGAAAAPQERMEAPVQSSSEALLLIHVLSDVPRFSTENGEFEFRKEEVAHIEERYASVLVKRGMAKSIDLTILGKD
jgi:DNA replication initiation complex subunit (GINS family)